MATGIVETLKSFIKPPSFQDEEKTQIARALHIILWTFIIIFSLLLLGGMVFPVSAVTRWEAAALFVYLLSAGLLLLNSRGKTTLSSWLLVTGLTMLMTVLAYTAGGISAQAVQWYIPIIFIAGLLLGGRAGVIVAVGCMISAFGLVVVEWSGSLPVSAVTNTSITKWITLVLLTIAVVSLQYLASVTIKNALRKTQEEVKRRLESEQKARVIFDRTFEFVGMLKPDGTLIEANKTAMEFAGIKPDDVLGKPFWETPWWNHSIEMKEMIRDSVQKAAAGEMVRTEAKHIAADGSLHDIDFSLKPVFDDNGKVIFLIPEGRDITDIRQADIELKASEERFRLILENMPILLNAFDEAGNFIIWNKACEKSTGYLADEIIGNPRAMELLYPDPEYRTKVWNSSLDSANKENTFSLVAKNGEVRTIEWFDIFHHLTIPGWSSWGIGQDITERKNVERALLESETKFRTIFESSRDAVAVSKKGLHIFANPAYLQMYGYENNDVLLGKSILNLIAPSEHSTIRTYVEKRVKGEPVPTFYESRGKRKDGTEFPMEVVVSTFTLNNEQYSMTVQRDITERKQIENSLRESEELYRTLITTVPDVILRTDLKGNILFVNETRFPSLNYTPKEQILGKNIVSFIANEERNRAIQNLNQMFVRPTGLNEYTLVFEDDVRLQCEVNGEILRDANHNPYNIVFVVRDISQRKQAEDNLKESEAQFRSLFENAPVGIFYSTVSGKIIQVNEEYARMMGYTSPDEVKEIVNRSSIAESVYVHSNERVDVMEKVKMVPGNWFRTEKKFHKKDGAQIIANVIIRANPANPNHLEGFLEDITERKEMEEALRERLKEMTCLSEVSHAISMRLSTEELCEKIVGYLIPAMQYPDITIPIIILDGKKFSTSKYSPTLEYGLHSNINVNRKIRGKLSVYYTEHKDFLIPYEQNLLNVITQELGRWVEQNEVEEQARHQQLQLLHADKMTSLGVLVSGVAHEINNPNNLVMFNSDLISQIFKDALPVLDEYYAVHSDQTFGGLPYQETRKEVESVLNGISIGSQRIRDIVAGLKEFARVDTGQLNQEVRINEVVQSALLIVGNLIKKSTDHFSVEYDTNIKPAKGNIQQIEQVIINLLTNACQSLSDRKHAIHLRTLFNPAGKQLQVIVSDEGIGMSESVLQHLFDPFFTTKRDQGGTGLGLSVSYNIIQAHNGALSVESEEGKGTIMTLSLPEEIAKEI